jgi:hypothetical protein
MIFLSILRFLRSAAAVTFIATRRRGSFGVGAVSIRRLIGLAAL